MKCAMCHQYGPGKSFRVHHTIRDCRYIKKRQLQQIIQCGQSKRMSSDEERRELEKLLCSWCHANSESEAVGAINIDNKIQTLYYHLNFLVILQAKFPSAAGSTGQDMDFEC